MPNKNTIAVINDLKEAGFDTSAIERAIQANPLQERQADSILGGGVLRRQEFTQYKEDKDTEVENLRKQVRQLATNQDALKNFEGHDELYAQALEVIEVQRQNLIDAGFDPEEVKNLSMKSEEGLRAATKKADKIEEEEERKMPDKNKDTEDFVRAQDLAPVLANLAGGSIRGSIRAQNQLMKARQLGIELTDAKVAEFEDNLIKGLEQGKTYDQVADETFGFTAVIEAKRKEEVEKEIESKTREGVAKALREAGVDPNRAKTNTTTGLISNLRSRIPVGEGSAIQGSGGTRKLGDVEVPVNKHGETEFYRLRGDKASRVNNAAEQLQKLYAEHPDLMDLMQ